MCLAVPGQIVELVGADDMRSAVLTELGALEVPEEDTHAPR